MESKPIEKYYGIEWFNDKEHFHRLDGPAIEWNSGTKEWWVDGLRHREDGPAIELFNGSKGYYLNNIRYSEDQYPQEVIKLKLNRIRFI